ncbi:MAG TPA: adenylate/guanylate cyclase domain-containing protein [Terrimicrobiaceae bacterium]
MKRTNWPIVAGFLFAAAFGYLILRNWLKVEAHDLYIIGLVFLVVTFMVISRRLARSARELRAAVARADESLAAARAAERKYRSIFENAGEGIFQTDPDGRYLAANPALARLYGYSAPADLIHAVTSIGTQIYVDPHRRDEFLKEMQTKGAVADFESQVRRVDGSLLWISENAHAIRNEKGDVLYFEGIVEDITERKRIEIEHEERTQRELRHQRCLLDLAQFDKSDFGAALSVLLEATSHTLGIARTSAWRLVDKNSEREAIALLDLYELEKRTHLTDEVILKETSFPRYFAALRSETHIVAHEAPTDLRTSEFTETYLNPLGITAMLDVPIFVTGELAGVLCLEHVGGPRTWKDDELAFGAAVGNMISVTFEAAERRRAEDEADRERERAEQLLLNILPISVAQRLRRGEGLIADHYTEATVLFADIVDFTRISANIAPEAVVGYLNIIFSEFDQLAENLNLEKIKTIGDAYMVVGGVPTPRTDHIEAVIEMALAMLDSCIRLSHGAEMPFTMRIGINTGPVVAGVIGIKKFIYDLWGDTVNLASRMESHGVTGEIQVTEAVYKRMREKYLFEPRGKIDVKGRGEQQTYLLKGRCRNVSQISQSKEPARI